MATQTPNLGLTLPVGGENVSRQIINQNMTLIDQYCGAINQSTYRLVPFTLAVNDWVSSGGQWVVDFSTAYVTASSDEIITFGSSLTNAQAHIIAEKRSGGGGVKFTTATKPTGAIQGMIRIFDNDDHKIPILVEGTVTPIANGGTGQSTLSGAQQALGITALSNQITALNGFESRTIAWINGSTNLNDCTDPTKVYAWGNVYPTNTPTTNCRMFYYPGDAPVQIIIKNDGSAVYRRINVGGWSAWGTADNNVTVNNALGKIVVVQATISFTNGAGEYDLSSVLPSGYRVSIPMCCPNETGSITVSGCKRKDNSNTHITVKVSNSSYTGNVVMNIFASCLPIT